MDETNGRRETHDFMNVNVESFSQLPFIRRTPPPSKERASKIRLFGQELIGDNSSSQELQDLSVDSSDLTTTTTKNNEESSENVKDKDKDKDSNNNNRRFECHYCFRNFPTSQALGGHQNAHKRERQHAKRGSMTSYLNQHHHDPHHHHVYGYLNHHRHYPTWTTESRTFYGGGGGGGQYSRALPSPTPPTINGSPLGLWRVPPSSTSANTIHHHHGVYSASPSTFRNHHHEQEAKEPTTWPYSLMKPNVQDHVSLDLHL